MGRLQYSLRQLLGFVLLAALLAWFVTQGGQLSIACGLPGHQSYVWLGWKRGTVLYVAVQPPPQQRWSFVLFNIEFLPG